MLDDHKDAVSLVAALERRFPSHSIVWESILAHQYGRCLSNPGTAVDVGANEGLHVWSLLACNAQKVVCFEPIPALAAELASRFQGKPVTVHQVALSNSSGSRTFHLNLSVPTESGLEPRKFSDDAHRIQKIEVITERLDAFELNDVDFMKLDCEGAELDVLRGGAATVGRSRPLISVEYGAAGYLAYGHKRFALFEWACGSGYIVSDLFGRPMMAIDAFDRCVDRYYWDFFLVPRDRSEEIEAKLREGATIIFNNFERFLNS